MTDSKNIIGLIKELQELDKKYWAEEGAEDHGKEYLRKLRNNFPAIATAFIEFMEEKQGWEGDYEQAISERDRALKMLGVAREAIDWAIGKCHEQSAGFHQKIINGLEKTLNILPR